MKLTEVNVTEGGIGWGYSGEGFCGTGPWSPNFIKWERGGGGGA